MSSMARTVHCKAHYRWLLRLAAHGKSRFEVHIFQNYQQDTAERARKTAAHPSWVFQDVQMDDGVLLRSRSCHVFGNASDVSSHEL
jgi:hypothetical protein